MSDRCNEQGLRCGFDPKPKFCERHGPAVRNGKPKPAAVASLKSRADNDGLTVLPTKAQRWAQILGIIETQYLEFRGQAFSRELTEWDRQLHMAVAVDFSERE